MMEVQKMSNFDTYCSKQDRAYGEKFVMPTGEEFISAYNKGQDFRILVETDLGSGCVQRRWGYVGITTGWRPCFLLLRRAGQHGSSDTLDPVRDKVVARRWLKVKNRREL